MQTVPLFPNLTKPKSPSSTVSRPCSPAGRINMLWMNSSSGIAPNRGIVLRYRLQLEAKSFRLRPLMSGSRPFVGWQYEAADTGLLSLELVAGIRRVKGVPQLGRRVGNRLSAAEGEHLLSGFGTQTLRDKRDLPIISLLLGCALRRSEVVALKVGDIQRREDHWAINAWTQIEENVRSFVSRGRGRTGADPVLARPCIRSDNGAIHRMQTGSLQSCQ